MSRSVMIATPMYGGMCSGAYTQSLMQTVAYLAGRGDKVAYVHMMNESLITRARNELVRLFMSSTCDYLMFIDADIIFPPDGIAMLLDAGRGVACGIYPKKEVNWDTVRAAALRGADRLQDHAGAFVLNALDEGPVATDEHGMIAVRHGGTGFMLVHRSVFETLKPHVPTYHPHSGRDAEGNYIAPEVHEYFATSIDATKALLSEDYHFCELWAAHGGTVYANPFIQLGHVGTYLYSGDVVKMFAGPEGE